MTVVLSGVPASDISTLNSIDPEVLTSIVSGGGNKQPGLIDAAWMLGFRCCDLSIGGSWVDCVQPDKTVIRIKNIYLCMISCISLTFG